MSSSLPVNEAIAKAEEEGNSVLEVTTGWTKLNEVVHMTRPISDDLRSVLLADKRLRGWSSEATPHNKADEGFTDDIEKVAISFPREN